MTYNEYMRTVLGSTDADWNVITCWGSGSGPSYRERIVIIGTPDGQRLETESHSSAAAFLPDLAITMAWGFKHLDEFSEPWANSFPDKHASSSWLDFFYNGALIGRDLYVEVDGGRVMLPIPDRETLVVSRRDYQLVRLLQSLSGTTYSFEEYFRRAGLKLAE